MIMDMKEKIKDNIKAKMDISLFCNRKNMELSFDGSWVAKPRAFFVCRTIGFIFFTDRINDKWWNYRQTLYRRTHSVGELVGKSFTDRMTISNRQKNSVDKIVKCCNVRLYDRWWCLLRCCGFKVWWLIRDEDEVRFDVVCLVLWWLVYVSVLLGLCCSYEWWFLETLCFGLANYCWCCAHLGHRFLRGRELMVKGIFWNGWNNRVVSSSYNFD